ncbi:uncharacterized protein LOC123707386 [Pieris brassicae]|uniref:SANT domain-containing protein n=1 Tax=Pieris brassicae TaxID=7116 RepID=A0A9P0T4W6_PIEBR|nr:uncharacterized protein LOC123707386 [Pieris brassicae]XP_045513353.1 uncharacterized protein LOC123707386 [Pieris brassicae]CAH4019333.1 unnamed protein product [Pieris brassicae]
MSETTATPVEGWSKEEKFNLLRAIREFGSHDIEKIQGFMFSKSCDEISGAIEYYRSKAFQNPNVKRKREKRKLNTSTTPLGRWASALMDNKGYDELRTDISTALRLVAEFEERSPKTCTEQYNFGAVYQALANALDGRVLPDDQKVNALIEKCLIDTAVFSKAFKRNSLVKDVINDINLSTDWMDDIVLLKASDDSDLANIRHIIGHKAYNPLNISINHLQCGK